MKSPLRHPVSDTVHIHSHLASESQQRITALHSRLRNGSTEKKTRFDSAENGRRETRHREVFDKVNLFNDKLAKTLESEQANFETLAERLERLHQMLKSQREHRLALEVNKKQDLSDLGLSLGREVPSAEQD